MVGIRQDAAKGIRVALRCLVDDEGRPALSHTAGWLAVCVRCSVAPAEEAATVVVVVLVAAAVTTRSATRFIGVIGGQNRSPGRLLSGERPWVGDDWIEVAPEWGTVVGCERDNAEVVADAAMRRVV